MTAQRGSVAADRAAIEAERQRRRTAYAREAVGKISAQDAEKARQGAKLKPLIELLKERKSFVEEVDKRRKVRDRGKPVRSTRIKGRMAPEVKEGTVKEVFKAATARFGSKEKATRFMEYLNKSGLIRGGKVPLILLSLLGIGGLAAIGGASGGDRRAA